MKSAQDKQPPEKDYILREKGLFSTEMVELKKKSDTETDESHYSEIARQHNAWVKGQKRAIRKFLLLIFIILPLLFLILPTILRWLADFLEQ